MYNRPLYKGHSLRFQIFTFNLLPPRKRQLLYKGQHKWINFILSPTFPLFGDSTVELGKLIKSPSTKQWTYCGINSSVSSYHQWVNGLEGFSAFVFWSGGQEEHLAQYSGLHLSKVMSLYTMLCACDDQGLWLFKLPGHLIILVSTFDL